MNAERHDCLPLEPPVEWRPRGARGCRAARGGHLPDGRVGPGGRRLRACRWWAGAGSCRRSTPWGSRRLRVPLASVAPARAAPSTSGGGAGAVAGRLGTHRRGHPARPGLERGSEPRRGGHRSTRGWRSYRDFYWSTLGAYGGGMLLAELVLILLQTFLSSGGAGGHWRRTASAPTLAFALVADRRLAGGVRVRLRGGLARAAAGHARGHHRRHLPGPAHADPAHAHGAAAAICRCPWATGCAR